MILEKDPWTMVCYDHEQVFQRCKKWLNMPMVNHSKSNIFFDNWSLVMYSCIIAAWWLTILLIVGFEKYDFVVYHT